MNQETLDNYEKAFRSIMPKSYILSYAIDGRGQMEYQSIVCLNEDAEKRNIEIFGGNVRIFDLVERKITNS